MKIKKLLRHSNARDGHKIHTLKTTLQSVSQERRAKELRAQLVAQPTTTRIKLKLPDKGKPAVTPENSKLRKLWNRSMPVLNCSNCAFSSQCPKFKSGYECAFLPFFTSHSIETPNDIIFYTKELLQQGIRRIQQGMMFETMSGAAPGIELSEQLSNLFAQLTALYDRMKEDATVELESNSDTLLGSLFGKSSDLLEDTKNSLGAISELNSLPEVSKELQSVTAHADNPEVHQELISHVARTSKPGHEN